MSNTLTRSIRFAGLTLLSGTLLFAASPARSEPMCEDIKKYVEGKAAQPFMQNHGTAIGPNQWKARRQIRPGDCTVMSSATPTLHALTCIFNKGAEQSELLSYSEKLGADIQTCLDSLNSRFDWRKRDTSRTEADGRSVRETTWIWTMLRDQTERQVRVSNIVGGADPSRDALIVLWRSLDDN